MSAWWIWGAALTLYLLFRLWYDGWRGPLAKPEVDQFLAEVAGRFSGGNETGALRAFLEADDGKEFVMLNLVKVEPGNVIDPATGKEIAGRAAIQRYSGPFVRRLIANGGHPGMVGRKVGPYVDAWNVEGDPGWSIFGLMRYRSRRDLMRMVADPRFAEHHAYKALGIPVTFSFPSQRELSVYLGPRVWVALVLALGAALAQLTLPA